MKYQRLKNLVILVTAAAYFAATFLGQQMKLRILDKLLIISQRFFGIPPFRSYALADGIRQILSQSTLSPPQPPPASLQLELTLGWQGREFWGNSSNKALARGSRYGCCERPPTDVGEISQTPEKSGFPSGVLGAGPSGGGGFLERSSNNAGVSPSVANIPTFDAS
jgi:hypothetical protein